MVKLTVAGIIGCPRFERARHCAQRLKRTASLELDIIALFESQFEAYMQRKIKDVGSYYFTHSGSPVVTLDDKEYVGGAEELVKWAYVRYHDNDIRTMEDYTDMSQAYRIESFVQLPNIYVHFLFAIGCSRATFPITIELYTEKCPKACLNVVHLCHGDRKDDGGKAMTYLYSEISRIVAGSFVVFGKKPTIYGEYLADECYEIKHDAAGIVGVTNEGHNQHTSQLYVTLAELPSFNRRFQIIGRVVEGLQALLQVSTLPTKSEKPLQRVYVTAAGLMPENPRTLSYPLKVALKEKLGKKVAGEIFMPEILETPRPNFESHIYQFIRQKTSKAVKTGLKLPTVTDVLWRTLSPRRAVKIIASLGPSCSNVPEIIRMLDVGMNIARVKMGTLPVAEILELIDMVREANRQRPDRTCAVMLELAGGRVRVGKFKKEDQVIVETGSKITLSDDQSKTGNPMRIIVSKIVKNMPVGCIIHIGKVKCAVNKYGKSGLHIDILKGGEIARHMKVTYVGFSDYTFDQEDEEAIATVAGPKEVEFLLLNSVESRQDAGEVKRVMEQHGVKSSVVARLCSNSSLEKCEEIVYYTDGIMFSRGDHFPSLPLSRLFTIEHRLLSICKAYGKPAIAAMPILESLETLSKPSRADCLNAASLVLDGYDALMLGKSTATGQNHVSSVQYLARLCCEGEKFPKRVFKLDKDSYWMADRAVRSAVSSKAAAILLLIHTASDVAPYTQSTLPCPTLAFTSDKLTAGYMSILRGITPIHMTMDKDSSIQSALSEVRRRSLISAGEQVIIVIYKPDGLNELLIVEVTTPPTAPASLDDSGL